MARKSLLGVAMVGAMSLVGFPVFAEGPVNISIVEKVDDGTGNYKDWEDIVNAMPGMTYSAMPQVKNNGDVATSVRMCLTESGMDAVGNAIELDEGTFQIDINDGYWAKISGNDSGGSVSSPIEVCYKYNEDLVVGELTEPLFREVYLSERLGNEYRNATFTLHLDAYASGDLPDGPVSPDEPNTGVFTNSEPLTTAGYVFLSFGVAVLLAMIVYLLQRSVRKK